MKALLVTSFIVILIGFPQLAVSEVPDPDHSFVAPWDDYGQAFMSPGLGGDSVLVMLRDSASNFCPGVFVEVDISACSTLCVDYPNGLSGVTDQFGMLILDPRVGGCETCDVIVWAGGVELRTYTNVVSPDWDGIKANGMVDIADLAYFMSHNPSPPYPYESCLDYNADGVIDIIDTNLFSACQGGTNVYPCDGYPCVVSPPGLDFGTVTIGEWKEKTFRITNTGISTDTLRGEVSDTCGSFLVMSGAGPYELLSGESLIVAVSFSPFFAGPDSCVIGMGEASCSDVICKGTGEEPPDCVIDPENIDFGTLFVGDQTDTTFIITNIGGGTLDGTVGESCSHYSIVSGDGPYSLAADETLMVAVRFQPTSAGPHPCTVETGSPLCSDVSLTGVGEDPPACDVSPDNVDFETVFVGSSRDTTFFITNTGGGTLNGTVSETCSHYSIVSGGGPYTLFGGDTLLVTVRFQPSADGTHNCTVETGDALCTDVSCTGHGEPVPVCLVEPTSVDFDTLLIGESADTSFIVTNTGGGTLNGTVSETCSHYSIVSGDGPYSLAADETLTVAVHFEPVSSGTHPCTVETGSAICDDVSLSGFGEELPAFEVFPDSIYFGTVYVGSYRDTTFFITNTGGGTLSGAVSETCDHYSLVAGGGPYSLAGGDTLLVAVRFEPTDTGPHGCTIDTGDPLFDDVECLGEGGTPPACAVQPDTLDFGTVSLGDWSDLTFLITNVGGGLLNGSVSEPCSYFSVESGGGAYSLAASESLTVTVRFAPAAEGPFSCTIATGQALCSNVYATGAGSADPAITSITDVGNDQGRSVRIIWDRCSYDASGDTVDVVSYGIYRRQAPNLSGAGNEEIAAPAVSAGGQSPQISGWDYVGTVPARGDGVYQYVAPTLCDSTISQGMCWSVFLVSAMTTDPLVFYDSAPDSGYSLDNLSPHVPSGFAVAYNTGGGNDLSWDESPDGDFQHFRIYRGESEDFTPSPGNYLHGTTDTGWTDPAEEGWRYHYKISAVDFSGNESPPASSESVTGTGGPMQPTDYALYQNVPNPFNPTTAIRYDVPAGGGLVTLRVYDVNGGLVRTLVDSWQSHGQRTVVWDGRDERGQSTATGVYFYRMTAPGFEIAHKMVLLQ